jgi:alcohol dehydrogenase (cytochrome c)
MTHIRKTMRIGMASVVASGLLAFGQQAVAEVTFERLLNAQSEPQNWLLPYGSYNSHNHSNLSQINRSNVGDLRVKFTQAVGGSHGNKGGTRHQQAPAVDNGFMYITNAWGLLFKIDIRSGSRGEILWINDSEPESARRMRGIPSLLGNHVYVHPSYYEARLLKIDANSGETVWDMSTTAPVEEAGTADTRHSIQPLALKNQLLVGATGGVRRNFVAAYDADNGDLMWRFYTVPAPDEPGGETWADDWNAYLTGRAAIWTQGSYDPETNLVLYGTGEPGPWRDASYRPGDNLYTNSVVAIDVDTGELEWFFQEIPNESWDYDTVNPRMLYDIEVDGVTRQLQGNFSRNGYYYSIDRTNGDFLYAKTYTVANWTAGLDPKTGLPVEYNPNELIQTYAPGMALIAGDPTSAQNVCPYYSAMPTFQPPTYDAGRMTAFIATQDGCFSPFQVEPFAHESYVGKSFPDIEDGNNQGPQVGAIWAVDVRTAEMVRSIRTEIPHYSGTLGTAGDLIFTATLAGKFSAYDKDTLAELWSFHTGTAITAPPITYAIDGRQYVAILAGGQDRSGNARRPELKLLQQAPSVFVFGL